MAPDSASPDGWQTREVLEKGMPHEQVIETLRKVAGELVSLQSRLAALRRKAERQSAPRIVRILDAERASLNEELGAIARLAERLGGSLVAV